jgi:hypothetical protein
MQCLRSFQSTERTRAGVEAIDLIRKGQVKRLDGSDGVGQERFVESLFQLAGSRKPVSGLTCLNIFLATLPISRIPPRTLGAPDGPVPYS